MTLTALSPPRRLDGAHEAMRAYLRARQKSEDSTFSLRVAPSTRRTWRAHFVARDENQVASYLHNPRTVLHCAENSDLESKSVSTEVHTCVPQESRRSLSQC